MNKVHLINFLKQYFEEGFHVKQARGNARFVNRLDPTYDLYVVTEIEPVEIWKISDIQGNFNEKHRKLILFTYCFSGCDTTSALAGVLQHLLHLRSGREK